MPRLPLVIAMLIALCMPCLAVAGEVYKCTDAQGSVAFQDFPCPVDVKQSRLYLPDVPATPSQAAPDDNAPQPSAPPPVAAARRQTPLPPIWLCQSADDGSRYFSRNGNPPVRYVPLGVLGYPGQSLDQTYSPPGGLGMSASGERNIPINTSPNAAFASGYTPLQDRCLPASREQTCDYLRKQYDQVEHKLIRAFKDEQAVLQPQDDELRNQLDGC